MKNSEVLDLIMRRVGNRKNTLIRTAATEELQVKIQELERQPTPPWFLETIWDTTVETAVESLLLPDDFLLEIEETSFVLSIEGVKYKLHKRVLHDLREDFGNAQPGIPKYYALFGNKVIFAPAPAGAYSISLPYIRQSAPFADNSDDVSDWLVYAFTPMVLSACASVAGDVLQNEEKAGIFSQRAAASWMNFNTYCESRRYANLEVSTGDDE